MSCTYDFSQGREYFATNDTVTTVLCCRFTLMFPRSMRSLTTMNYGYPRPLSLHGDLTYACLDSEASPFMVFEEDLDHGPRPVDHSKGVLRSMRYPNIILQRASVERHGGRSPCCKDGTPRPWRQLVPSKPYPTVGKSEELKCWALVINFRLE